MVAVVRNGEYETLKRFPYAAGHVDAMRNWIQQEAEFMLELYIRTPRSGIVAWEIMSDRRALKRGLLKLTEAR